MKLIFKRYITRSKSEVACPLIQCYGQTDKGASALLTSVYDISSWTTGWLQNKKESKSVDYLNITIFLHILIPNKNSWTKREIMFQGIF